MVALTIFMLTMFLPVTLQAANAQTNTYTIQHVDHNIKVLYSGNVVITDQIQLSGTAPSSFQIGLPYRYGAYVVSGVAYDSDYNMLPMALGVQLQDQSGFYAADINPQGATTFTVIFILSNGVLTPTSSSTGYNLDFPGYPAFTQAMGDCNVTVTLPSTGSMKGIEQPNLVVNASSYETANVAAFTYSPALATFTIDSGYIQKVNIPSLTRQININSAGDVSCTDTYKIVNNSTSSMYSFLVNLPVNSSDVVARDQFGTVLSTSTQQTNSQVFVKNVTLAISVTSGDTTLLTLDYTLPKISVQGSKCTADLDLFPYFNYIIDSASVTITPPEGATITAPQASQLGASDAVTRNVYQETLTINKQDVSYIDSVIPSQETLTVTYDYNALWVAFRPTSWMWAIVAVGAVVVVLWNRPKTKAKAPTVIVPKIAPGTTLSPEHSRDLADSYEEKNKLHTEIRSLEARAKHGRIPRRRYKVQRKALETRLDAVNQKIAHLKEIHRRAGGSYADLVRQLESAEAELEDVEMTLQNVDERHETGELSLETFRKQHADLERRQQKAEDSLNGLLIRLRGEST
jgi:hypothetical protein